MEHSQSECEEYGNHIPPEHQSGTVFTSFIPKTVVIHDQQARNDNGTHTWYSAIKTTRTGLCYT